jgi:hypothetical protein
MAHVISLVAAKVKARLRVAGLSFGIWFYQFGFGIWRFLFYGTTACEKPLLGVVFVFEHFFYSSATVIL